MTTRSAPRAVRPPSAASAAQESTRSRSFISRTPPRQVDCSLGGSDATAGGRLAAVADHRECRPEEWMRGCRLVKQGELRLAERLGGAARQPGAGSLE